MPFLMDLTFSALRWACAGLIDFSLGILEVVGLEVVFDSSDEVVLGARLSLADLYFTDWLAETK